MPLKKLTRLSSTSMRTSITSKTWVNDTPPRQLGNPRPKNLSMVRKVLLATGVGFVAAGSIEVISSDLSGGSNRVVDNIKGKWSQTLKFLGKDATLEANYDRSAKQDFLESATLSGKCDDVSYECKTTFAGDVELTASADTKDGTNVEVVANNKDGVTKLTAARDTKMFDRDVAVEASHTTKDSASKLKLSSVLGHGLTASGTVTMKNGARSEDYELEYDATLGEGRTVSATVNPVNGAGAVEYEDSKTIDATVTASMDIGGKPKVTVRRSWGF